MIWDALQSRDYVDNGRTHADGIQAKQVFDIIVAQSYEHGACVLAIRYGLARANAGHVSIQKLSKATGLGQKRCDEIMEDMRRIARRCGVGG
mgnify:CR=1 FL=1